MIKEIDHNGNGVIEPAEFDHDLKQQDLSQCLKNALENTSKVHVKKA